MESSRPYADFLRILERDTDLLNEDPVREEIFSAERLEQYAEYLAGIFEVKKAPNRGRSLAPLMKKSARDLMRAYKTLSDVMRNKQPFSPAAEWFVDNFNIVENQLREIKRDLPENYYYELPKLASGGLKDYPRVYGMALAIITHTDSRLDAEMIRRFVNAFQRVAPLTIGELWAIHITLRIALIEKLKPLALRIVSAREKRQQADELADKLLELSGRSKTSVELLVKSLSEGIGKPELFDRAYLVQLTQRLRDQDPNIWPALEWIETNLREFKTDMYQVTQLEHKRQAEAQVTVGNIITSMRLISDLDWRDFFESVSLVDPILKKDPSGTYPKMDFQARDRYRHSIERISKRSNYSELEVVQKLIEVASTEKNPNADVLSLRNSHVGYYLIDEGRRSFEKSCGYRPRFTERIHSFVKKHPTLIYLGSFLILTCLFASLVTLSFVIRPHESWVMIFLMGLIVFLSSEFALSIVNHYVTFFIKPTPLPKLATRKGIPEDAKTMVVVPTLFTSVKGVEDLVENLQIHYLANKDPNIFFALLGDFADSRSETAPDDSLLLRLAEKGITELNSRYPHSDPKKKYFYLFVRKRAWNETEQMWIGWERKRGKLNELNRILRGATDTSYLPHSADPKFLAEIKYIITLDSDTQLPRDSARRLIGTIVHPLNQPYFDNEQQRVTKGYGILQPRVSVSLVSASKTFFAKIFSGNTGLDPYTTAVSDVYQDLFNEGSYTGKGLYVVDAFEKSLFNRIPENRLLSHDLFEGSYARSGLVTDIEFFDDYPSDFGIYSKRQHRWTRGDWQIAQWLSPTVPTGKNVREKNTLSLIAKWKIFDNLRRSLVPTAIILWLLLCWLTPSVSPIKGTVMFLILLVFPAYAPLTNSMKLFKRGMTLGGHLRNIWDDVHGKFLQLFLTVTFLPDLAWVQTDAIIRTLYRKIWSKKKLLEWVPFAQIEERKNVTKSLWERIGPAPIFAISAGYCIWIYRADAFFYASPLLLLWIASPVVKSLTAKRIIYENKPLDLPELKTLRRYARRTWYFFENFVTEQDNWLAPDNFQEDPQPIVAHRTSPTNIGLQILATISARDFGYIGYLEFIERIENIFVTLKKLSKLKGHFFNWYDTQTLEAMRPQYVSTVDSGNLAGHLLVLKQACIEYTRRPFITSQTIYGIVDTFSLLRNEILKASKQIHSSTFISPESLVTDILACLAILDAAKPENLSDWRKLLNQLANDLKKLKESIRVIAADVGEEKFTQINKWHEISSRLINELQKDLQFFSPWVGDELEAYSSDINVFLNTIPTIYKIPRAAEKISDKLNAVTAQKVKAGAEAARAIIQRSWSLQDASERFVREMDFKFLFDEQKKIFVIGYNVADNRLDNSFYDLLASESRLASFVAIAKGDIPQEHWFRLGRQITSVKGGRALISWTATMFEYLMPLLVMRRYSNTLLDQTYEAIVRRQIEYGKQNGVPWGVSEAGYNARDLQLNFQYGPFGVPGLGLKRGLSDDLVVSPYSTMLAAMVDPREGLKNLENLEEGGVFARYGFFESIDYTADRLQQDHKSFILRSFMAHHQGMSIVALNNIIHKNIMQRRFHSEPIIRATQLLLQERIPQESPITEPRSDEVRSMEKMRFLTNPNPRIYSDIQLPTPRTQILSNGTYSVMISSAGAGYSRSGPLAVSRWREDVTRDNWGQFIFIQNRDTGKAWSAGFQPVLDQSQPYEVTFAEERVEFKREDLDVTTRTEIIVSAEDNVELRRVCLQNTSNETLEFEVTSFLEIVLAKPADDSAHPAFSNLFVQTEFAPTEKALLATRRRRSNSEKQVWGFHVVSVDGEIVGPVQYETDRARFIGRGRSLSNPLVIAERRPLSATTGAVLDPIFSLRKVVRIPAGETARVLFATGISSSREDAIRLADKYRDIHIFARATELAWTKSHVQLRHLNIDSDEAHTFQRLAGRVIFSDPSLRPRSGVLAQNTKAQSALWAYGISGDLPIILARISDEKDILLVRELLHAHEYLRLKGLVIDLVILNEHSTSYVQSLQDELQRQIQMSGAQGLVDKPGGVYMRRADLIPPEDLALLKTVARVSLSAETGSLSEQITRRPVETELPELLPISSEIIKYPEVLPTLPELSFYNGLGGFTPGGRHYLIALKEGQWTPAPWINVIANSDDFGFIISECGSGYTWSGNSRENRLTPWSNDVVSDTPGEAIYIRDEATGEIWSPTPLPIREKELYICKHSQGYTQFEHTSHNISQELQVFAALDAPVKISRLRLKNLGTKIRELSVTGYVEWVLGFQKSFTSPFVISSIDKETGAILAKNPYNNEFAERVAFFDISEKNKTFTCDRKDFIGRNGTLVVPQGLTRVNLSGRVGAGLDPCGALQTIFQLAPNAEKEIIIILGQAATTEDAQKWIKFYKDQVNVRNAFKKVINYWDEMLGVIQVKTPDPAMDLLINRWLPYQTLSCRLWARSAFYQSGGAYGFRDQLQDVMALVYAKPAVAREQILRAAARQFKEGDVQHWWHPPTGRGVRTRCSDDLLWLPYVVSFYVQATNDFTILDEQVSFIDAPELEPGQDDAYIIPEVSPEKKSIYEHCIRSIEKSLKVGPHGLPLMGSCDWNDGMNLVGNEGKGESVWVAWFLYQILENFIPFCKKQGEIAKAAKYETHMKAVSKAIEENAWDGNWYRRAYFDNGVALGSSSNEECRIDSLAQSWAVLSGAGNRERAIRAMNAVDEYLINRGDGLVKLFTPPFDKSALEPGYIKGYLPGVRENGGQYTHAAIWTLMAYAELGDGDRAAELFSLLNPINHTSTPAGLYKYKVEPYVAAADIYGMYPHIGRGGWTWYTGSASWMYRAALESILGFKLHGDKLIIRPRISKLWREFSISYKHKETPYTIRVVNKHEEQPGKSNITYEVDGKVLTEPYVNLVNDGQPHQVQIRL